MRQYFENIISESPYELSIERYPLDETVYAWPGQYKDPKVQMAWDLFVEGWNHAIRTAAAVCEDRAYTKKETQFLGPELNSLNCAIAINKLTMPDPTLES